MLGPVGAEAYAREQETREDDGGGELGKEDTASRSFKGFMDHIWAPKDENMIRDERREETTDMMIIDADIVNTTKLKDAGKVSPVKLVAAFRFGRATFCDLAAPKRAGTVGLDVGETPSRRPIREAKTGQAREGPLCRSAKAGPVGVHPLRLSARTSNDLGGEEAGESRGMWRRGGDHGELLVARLRNACKQCSMFNVRIKQSRDRSCKGKETKDYLEFVY
ncbi:hypothetical protein BOTBODRAFT_45201 [Botryobasidium botryosum FD-172 SS1]|uniref:Uncharacterized protein n=1 Tax=Botryobasidium botryosum (strain FD-172 SS1) TaxID=930990 RepID=A0A067MPK9_BOTB1|nr:hypothetical protein BOTBODRAFT_45201 [Botryobasidium botryosum FD-172 SS1]